MDEMCLSTLQCIDIVQQQRAKWHDHFIKKKTFQKGDWVLLYTSRFQEFPGKLQTTWLGTYEMSEVYYNRTVCLTAIDDACIYLLFNGH